MTWCFFPPRVMTCWICYLTSITFVPLIASSKYMYKSIARGTFQSFSFPLSHTLAELICQEQDRSVSLLPPLIAALRQLLKWEQEIRWVGGMRYHKLNWDLICDGISKHRVWRFAGNTLGGMSSPSGQAIALRLCKQFLITSVWLTGNADLRSRHKQATGVSTAAATWC